jgi:hypothetical protein
MTPRRPPARTEPCQQQSFWQVRATTERLVEERKRRTADRPAKIGFREP